jgi:hypothetical protein
MCTLILADSTLKVVQKAPVILKTAAKAGHECTWKKWTHESKGKPNRNFMRLSEKIVKLVNVFKEASKDLILIFLCNKSG